MARQDFIPDKDGDFLAWHDNFKTQATALATKYGITTAQVTALNNDNTDLHTDFADADAKKAASQAANAKKRSTKRTKTGNARALARQIKASSLFDHADGQLLRIEGPEDSTDLTTAKPTLRATAVTPGSVTISFNKSISDGVRIMSKRGSETAFSFLAIDTESPYVDTRPNLSAGPETRQYQAQYLTGDEPIGNLSDGLTVTAPGVSPAPL